MAKDKIFNKEMRDSFLYNLEFNKEFCNKVNKLLEKNKVKKNSEESISVKMNFKNPIERNREKEKEFIDKLIDNFDFEGLFKMKAILPVVLGEDYNYFNGCNVYDSVETMKENAIEMINQCLDIVFDNGNETRCIQYAINPDTGKLDACYVGYIGGIYNVEASYYPTTQEYFGKISFDIFSSENY